MCSIIMMSTIEGTIWHFFYRIATIKVVKQTTTIDIRLSVSPVFLPLQCTVSNHSPVRLWHIAYYYILKKEQRAGQYITRS